MIQAIFSKKGSLCPVVPVNKVVYNQGTKVTPKEAKEIVLKSIEDKSTWNIAMSELKKFTLKGEVRYLNGCNTVTLLFN